MAAFSKATRIRPKSFEAQSSLGAALHQRGDFAGAKSAYEAALKLSPDHPSVMWCLAQVAEQVGNAREAERLYMALGSKVPKAEVALFRLGSLRFDRGDYGGSVEAYRSCLKARKDWPAAQLNLGLSLWKSNQFAEARQRLESVNGSFAGEALRALAVDVVRARRVSASARLLQEADRIRREHAGNLLQLRVDSAEYGHARRKPHNITEKPLPRNRIWPRRFRRWRRSPKRLPVSKRFARMCGKNRISLPDY